MIDTKEQNPASHTPILDFDERADRPVPEKPQGGGSPAAQGEKGKKKSDLGVRTVAGFVYFVVTAACVLLSDITAMAYLAAIAGMCAFEFYRMMKRDDKLVNEWLGIAAAAAFPIVAFFFGLPGIVIVASVFLLALILWYVCWPKARIIDLCLTVFGAMYMGMSLSCLLVVRMDLGALWGGVTMLALIASVWLNDVGAYLVGRAIGKHRMAPIISPKKTWEGFFGGLAFSVLFWCGMSFIPAITLSTPQAVGFGLLCGVMGVVGDLAESRMKRNVGVKDSGTIMPGHGGMFDRTDSLLTVSVTAARCLYLGGCIPNVVI